MISRRAVCALGILLTMPAIALPAQDPGQVESLASLLMMQDRRAFDQATLQRLLGDPDSLVRRTAVQAVGRLGDPRGVPLLLPLLGDRDAGVATETMFALGALHDTAAVPAIIRRLTLPDPLGTDAVAEGATALAKIGGTTAAR